ncbi:hypothetical protein Heshes_00350 [Alicyclobacillus hesperidum]|uniref:Uncharacterized protein n=1 Tax=Alicyclobacillus hesperidum TaxID=89784 RepID=A0AA37X121_9BACL|nr:hypothetical protein Heshes_00350 [Alicyclobacillus hesperidum]
MYCKYTGELNDGVGRMDCAFCRRIQGKMEPEHLAGIRARPKAIVRVARKAGHNGRGGSVHQRDSYVHCR